MTPARLKMDGKPNGSILKTKGKNLSEIKSEKRLNIPPKHFLSQQLRSFSNVSGCS